MFLKSLPFSEFEHYSQLLQQYGSLFNSLSWLNLNPQIQLYGIYDNQQKLIGGFHLCHTNKSILKHINNPPYTPHIGLFFENNSKNKSNKQSFEKSIVELLASFINELPAQIITLALPPSIVDLQPFIWKDFKVVPNYTYQINIEKNSIEEINSHFSPERRNDIKKAAKDGVTTSLNYDNKIVKNLVLKTFTRKQKELDEELLDKMLFQFANSENSFSFISYKNNLPSAAAFCIYNQQKAYYILGGYDNANKHQGSGASAVWECIKHSKKLGIEIFDFEGSMIPAVEKYFRGFGGDIIPYYTINKAPLPIEIALKFFKRSIF